jgi:hypothetical protein
MQNWKGPRMRPFLFAAPGERKNSEIGEADFGRAAAWAEWISKSITTNFLSAEVGQARLRWRNGFLSPLRPTS